MQLADNGIKLIANDWMLVSAGTKEKFNMMTASWGGIGYLWNKPVAYVFIRPERYTFEFIESNEQFSLSFFGGEYKEMLSLMGSTSGRTSDKVAASGLTPYFTELGTPAFDQARITMECKKLYSTMMCEKAFLDKTIAERWYTAHGSMHKIYIAEIVNLWIEQ